MAKKVVGNGRYSVATYQRATKIGAAIRTSRGTAAKPRLFHRDDLRRWVENEKAIDGQVITDPRNITPYRGACYGAIVLALQKKLPAGQVKNLQGQFSGEFTRIVDWKAEKNQETEAAVTTPWVPGKKLFAFACSLTPDLRKRLASRKSKRPGVKKSHRLSDPFVKFTKNVEVLQRTGGVTPYAKPLMDCQMAIDHRWVVVKSNPEIQYRLAVGRPMPQRQDKRTVEI